MGAIGLTNSVATIDLGWLSHQVAEILDSGAKTPSELHDKLIASPFSRSFVARNSCLGRLWIFIWALSRIFDWWGKWQKNAWATTLMKTQTVFQEALGKLALEDKTFKKHLALCLKDQRQVKQEEVDQVEQTLYLFRNHLLSALQHYGRGPLPLKVLHLQTLLGLDTFTDLSEFIQDTALLWLNKTAHIPPVDLLTKVTNDNPISAPERARWNAFVGRLADSQRGPHKLSIGELFLALKRLCFYLELHDLHQLGHLLFQTKAALEELKCPLFDQVDPSHRSAMLAYARGEYRMLPDGQELGPELPGRLDQSNHRLVFTLPTDPKQLAIASTHNPAALLTDYMLFQRGPLAPWAPQMSLSEDGLFLFVERLNSSRIPASHEEYYGRMQSIAKLIADLIKQGVWSRDLSLNTLFFNERGEVRLIKPLPLERVLNPYDPAMALVEACTLPFPQAEKVMLSLTGLSKHPIAQYYQAVLQNGLIEQSLPEGLEKNLEERGFPLAELQQNGVFLKKLLDELIEQCLMQLQSRYEVGNDSTLKIIIGSYLVTWMNPPSIKKKAIFDLDKLAQLVAKNKQLPLQPAFFEPIKMRVLNSDELLKAVLRGDEATFASLGLFNPDQRAALQVACISTAAYSSTQTASKPAGPQALHYRPGLLL